MPEGGYGEEIRLKKPFNSASQLASDGRDLYRDSGHLEEQVTVSYRTPQRGKLVTEKSIDPFNELLRTTAERKISKNGAVVAPIVYGDRAISYTPHRDNGHAFRSQTRYVTTSTRFGSHYVPGRTSSKRTGGPYFALNCRVDPAHFSRMPFQWSGTGGEQGRFGKIPRFTMPDLYDFGKKAIVVLAPGYPKSPLFTAVGELFAGVPNFIGHSLTDAFMDGFKTGKGSVPITLGRSASSEYLNYIFGVLPTIEDTIQVIENFKTLSDRLMQLEADSGKGVRRKMTFTMKTKSDIFGPDELGEHGNVNGTLVGAGFGRESGSSAGEVAFDSITSSLYMLEERKVSFSGSFSRFIPVDTKLPETGAKFYSQFITIVTSHKDGMGVRLTRERLWQLIPFSWLVDWFLSIKRSLALADRVLDDSLVINYGYVVGETKRSATQKSVMTFAPAKTASFTSVSTTYTSLTKERIRANPYGFITPNELELNPIRVGIMAALGVLLWR